MPRVDLTQSEQYIGGRWVSPHSRDVIEITSPGTGQVVGRAPDSDQTDVAAAVDAARAALGDPSGWSSWAPADRAAAMDGLATELDKRTKALAELCAVEAGKPVGLWRGGPNRGSELFSYFAELTRTAVFEEVRPSPHVRRTGSVRTLVRRLPIGVTGAIVPYNAPITLAVYKVAPTLAMGGTVVVKAPPQAPIDLFYLAEAVEAVGLPPGVVNIISGGAECGQALVAHPGVDKVAFTGSSAAGRSVAEACARQLKPVTLELGGKAAALLLPDAPLREFINSLPLIGFAYSGQNCFIHSRVLAPKSRYAEVVDAIADFAHQITVGDPMDEKTQLGPLISESHRGRVESYIESGRSQGAEVVTGGKRPPALGRGWYLEPTVFRNTHADMRICQEEIFGPVLGVISYEDEADALRIANGTEFGLHSTVWTSDVEHGCAVAEQIFCGAVGVNGLAFNAATPTTGLKNSGLGVELGPEGLEAYVRYQSIHLPR